MAEGFAVTEMVQLCHLKKLRVDISDTAGKIDDHCRNTGGCNNKDTGFAVKAEPDKGHDNPAYRRNRLKQTDKRIKNFFHFCTEAKKQSEDCTDGHANGKTGKQTDQSRENHGGKAWTVDDLPQPQRHLTRRRYDQRREKQCGQLPECEKQQNTDGTVKQCFPLTPVRQFSLHSTCCHPAVSRQSWWHQSHLTADRMYSVLHGHPVHS